jgi:hypothetical protein
MTREQKNETRRRYYAANREKERARSHLKWSLNRDKYREAARAALLIKREQELPLRLERNRLRAEQLATRRALRAEADQRQREEKRRKREEKRATAKERYRKTKRRWLAEHPEIRADARRRTRIREIAALDFLQSIGVAVPGTRKDRDLRRRAALIYVRQAGLLADAR